MDWVDRPQNSRGLYGILQLLQGSHMDNYSLKTLKLGWVAVEMFRFYLAYGSWARNTSGSQNLAVLRKRHDNSLFLRRQQKIETMLKLLCLLLIINSRIPGLVWRETGYFVQNKTTIILPGDTRRTTSELPCQTPATQIWRQIRNL